MIFEPVRTAASTSPDHRRITNAEPCTLRVCVFRRAAMFQSPRARLCSGPGWNRLMTVTSTSVSQQSELFPMTQAERWRYYFKSTFGVEGVLRSTAGAGISQLNNTPKRVGTRCRRIRQALGNSYAQHIMRETLMYGASSVFHEDNRYFPTVQSAFGQRLKYAIESSFLARRDDATRRKCCNSFAADSGRVGR
jgi:hypothetical protein